MEEPDHKLALVKQLEVIIERFVPKLFYDWNYSFEYGLTVYVPKKYIHIIGQNLSETANARYRILDIGER